MNQPTLYYWHLDGEYAVHTPTGYECNLLANLGPNYTWVDHITDTKPWANPTCLSELRDILNARANVAACPKNLAVAP
jgi:hypothetical protein